MEIAQLFHIIILFNVRYEFFSTAQVGMAG
jgi:hypothetical protein